MLNHDWMDQMIRILRVRVVITLIIIATLSTAAAAGIATAPATTAESTILPTPTNNEGHYGGDDHDDVWSASESESLLLSLPVPRDPPRRFLAAAGEPAEPAGRPTTTTVTTTNDSLILRQTFRVYGSLYLLAWTLFCVLRKSQRYGTRYFSIRSWVPELQSPLAAVHHDNNNDSSCVGGWWWLGGGYYVQWMWQVFAVSDEALLEHCGMDAICYLRALRFGRQLALMVCVNAVWLIPLYATAGNGNGNGNPSSSSSVMVFDPFVQISISHLPVNSSRFLGTVVAAYVLFVYAMYLLVHECRWFAHYRHVFLAQARARNYAIYVSGIPTHYRSPLELTQYFRHCNGSSRGSRRRRLRQLRPRRQRSSIVRNHQSYRFLGGAEEEGKELDHLDMEETDDSDYEEDDHGEDTVVLEAHVTRNIPELEAKVARREVVLRAMEHTLALEQLQQQKQKQRRRYCWNSKNNTTSISGSSSHRSLTQSSQNATTQDNVTTAEVTVPTTMMEPSEHHPSTSSLSQSQQPTVSTTATIAAPTNSTHPHPHHYSIHHYTVRHGSLERVETVAALQAELHALDRDIRTLTQHILLPCDPQPPRRGDTQCAAMTTKRRSRITAKNGLHPSASASSSASVVSSSSSSSHMDHDRNDPTTNDDDDDDVNLHDTRRSRGRTLGLLTRLRRSRTTTVKPQPQRCKSRSGDDNDNERLGGIHNTNTPHTTTTTTQTTPPHRERFFSRERTRTGAGSVDYDEYGDAMDDELRRILIPPDHSHHHHTTHQNKRNSVGGNNHNNHDSARTTTARGVLLGTMMDDDPDPTIDAVDADDDALYYAQDDDVEANWSTAALENYNPVDLRVMTTSGSDGDRRHCELSDDDLIELLEGPSLPVIAPHHHPHSCKSTLSGDSTTIGLKYDDNESDLMSSHTPPEETTPILAGAGLSSTDLPLLLEPVIEGELLLERTTLGGGGISSSPPAPPNSRASLPWRRPTTSSSTLQVLAPGPAAAWTTISPTTAHSPSLQQQLRTVVNRESSAKWSDLSGDGSDSRQVGSIVEVGYSREHSKMSLLSEPSGVAEATSSAPVVVVDTNVEEESPEDGSGGAVHDDERDDIRRQDSMHSVRSDASGKSATRRSGLLVSSISLGSRAVVETSKRAGSGLANAGSTMSSSMKKGSIEMSKSIVKGGRVTASAIKKVAKDTSMDKVVETVGATGLRTVKTATSIGTHVVTSAATVVPMLVNNASGCARDAGFVVFTNLFTTQAALQMVHHPKPTTMNVQEAPDPQYIFWRNVGMPHRARRTGLALSVTASAFLCIFWSIPVAFISSLTEVKSLKQSLPALGQFIERHPWAESMLALVAPLLLLVLNETVLPATLKFFAAWEGHISSAMLEASLFLKLGCFMVIQTFFVSIIGGSLSSISSELQSILQNPASIVNLLAISLPAQSSYFMQILLTSTFLLQGIELLRIYPLSLAFLRRFMGPNLTPKERRRSWGVLRSLEDPPDFWHAETFAQVILYFVVTFVYATVAPVTGFFLLFCFLLMECGYRYQYIHNYPPSFETGGRLWRTFLNFTFASMIIGQLTLMGLLLLKQSFYAVPALGPLLAITILFCFFFLHENKAVMTYLPTRDCVVLDDRFAQQEERRNLDFLVGAYLQPALKADLTAPDYNSSSSSSAFETLD